MRPAFSSTKSATAFAVLLLALLLLPALMGKSLLPPRSEIYTSTPGVLGPYHHLHREIFQKTNDIDIAFIGSSGILHGIDTPYVQEKLSEQLGREAVVITMGWDWSGFDAVYFIAQDLLQHRKVRMFVFTEDCRVGDDPHHAAPRWFRFGENAGSLAGLPLRLQAAYYFGSVIGMPRNLLSLVRTNIADLTPAAVAFTAETLRAPDAINNLGLMSSKLGFDHSGPNFVDYTPTNSAQPSDVLIYSPETKASFQIAGPSASLLQRYFAKKFAGLATEHHSELVCLHLPEIKEMRAQVIPEREFWPDIMQAQVALLGIPSAKMFAGLSDAEVIKLFLDPYHFNKNGLEFFTRLFTPALLNLYGTEVH